MRRWEGEKHTVYSRLVHVHAIVVCAFFMYREGHTVLPSLYILTNSNTGAIHTAIAVVSRNVYGKYISLLVIVSMYVE